MRHKTFPFRSSVRLSFELCASSYAALPPFDWSCALQKHCYRSIPFASINVTNRCTRRVTSAVQLPLHRAAAPAVFLPFHRISQRARLHGIFGAQDVTRLFSSTTRCGCPEPPKKDESRTTPPAETTESSTPRPDQTSVTRQMRAVMEKLRDAPLRENIWNIPNVMSMARIAASPVIGYLIAQGQYEVAMGMCAVAGFTDMLDGYIARKYNMQTLAGSILDPMADKTLMTILTIALATKDLLPVPLAVIIIGRDVGLVLAAFYYRYISLEPPKTLARYFDFSIPSAEVHPTMISKVNTALQLLLVGTSLGAPIFGYVDSSLLDALRWTVGATTIWSGASYAFSKNAVQILRRNQK